MEQMMKMMNAGYAAATAKKPLAPSLCEEFKAAVAVVVKDREDGVAVAFSLPLIVAWRYGYMRCVRETVERELTPAELDMIIISKDVATTNWLATYVGPHAEEVREKLGTTTLPTAFSVDMDQSQVVRELAQRNPRCIVQAAAP